MKLFTDSFSFLLQVFVVAFVAGLGWQLAGGLAIAVTEHLRTRLLARRLKKQADESLDTIKRTDAASLTIAVQEACCTTYLMTGGAMHAERCAFRSRTITAAEVN